MWLRLQPCPGLRVSEFPGLCELCEQLREGTGSQKRSFLLSWALNLPRPQVFPCKAAEDGGPEAPAGHTEGGSDVASKRREGPVPRVGPAATFQHLPSPSPGSGGSCPEASRAVTQGQARPGQAFLGEGYGSEAKLLAALSPGGETLEGKFHVLSLFLYAVGFQIQNDAGKWAHQVIVFMKERGFPGTPWVPVGTGGAAPLYCPRALPPSAEH